ncbi:MAG: hypothetical protein NC200_02690 [Candidatus Gastranaerophilales bacterium]|nr:hypothetical protein [Candidatus Gastranaerophilales bacterium]
MLNRDVLLRRYKRYNVEDSAYINYLDELKYIEQSFSKNDKEEIKVAKQQAYERFEKKSLLRDIDMRKKNGTTQSFKTWSTRQKLDGNEKNANLQDWINMIENFQVFAEINDLHEMFTSNQMNELYIVARNNNLSQDEAITRMLNIYNSNTKNNLMIDDLYALMMEELSK